MKSIGPHLPQKGFLQDYLDYAHPLTDAPTIYHLFCGLVAEAVAVGRKVYIPFGAQTIYLHLWVVLLGLSSLDRKTTSMNIARRLLGRLEYVNILPSEFSAERLVEMLSEKPEGLFIWGEFGSALAKFERDYMGGTKELLADLFDSPGRYTRETKGGSFTIQSPSFSILTGTPTEWLSRRVRGDDVRGGFFPRFLYVPRLEKGQRIAIPPPPDAHLESRLASQLHRIAQVEGAADFSRVEPDYREWLFEAEEAVERNPQAAALSAFHARLHVYALKLAVLYQLSIDAGLTVSPEAMQWGMGVVDFLKGHVGSFFGPETMGDRDEREKARVLRIILERPGIARGDLLRFSHLLAPRLEVLLKTLIGEELVGCAPPEPGRRAFTYWPTELARELNGLPSHALAEGSQGGKS